ncbi:MAG: undecaprenyldiphospho-muramoylpentapeptide beta-N-acetylglucosaminyltransferase [Treponemataceae bacterium]|nr:undecaprenyldiphospho-muramoylpentapeptide beta-N-acetylglucosaminyltransferase [Treponemataceae bacterium]
MINIVFVGGGTGGHIYPGLAVVSELKKKLETQGISKERYHILWIGSRNGLDKDIVEKDGSVDEFIGISCGKLRRYFSIKNFFDFFKILAGFLSSFFILLRLKPALLFSKGGFVSVPPCFASKILRIPVFTHECDFSPGLATRLNSRCASKILVSFDKTKNFFSEDKIKKTIVTGNPVRPVFYSSDRKRGREFLGLDKENSDEKPLLLILGGSLGALQINNLIHDNIDWLSENFTVIHQTGKSDYERFLTLSESFKNYHPYPFIYKEMPDVMAAADIVLSRAGSNFLWECSVTGRPLVLIPLSGNGTRGDQVENAYFFESQGAAKVLVGDAVNKDNLRKILSEMKDSTVREKLSSNIKKMSEGSEPAIRIADLIYREIHEKFIDEV